MLIFVYASPAGHNQKERKISDRARRGLEGHAEFRR